MKVNYEQHMVLRRISVKCNTLSLVHDYNDTEVLNI